MPLLNMENLPVLRLKYCTPVLDVIHILSALSKVITIRIKSFLTGKSSLSESHIVHVPVPGSKSYKREPDVIIHTCPPLSILISEGSSLFFLNSCSGKG